MLDIENIIREKERKMLIMKKNLIKITMIGIIGISSLFVGCKYNVDMSKPSKPKKPSKSVVSQVEYKEDVYYTIKFFMIDEFNEINRNLSNITFDGNEYQKVSKEEIEKRKSIVNENLKGLDEVIEATKYYSNLNEYFVNMKEYFIETENELDNIDYYLHSAYGSKTTKYDKEEYIFHDIKMAMIADGIEEKYIEDWELNKVE